jgi:chemotaxis protein MotB
VPAKRLSAVGFGHVKPLVDPSRPSSQELNKRVDIVVLSALNEESKELLSRVVYDREHGVAPKDTVRAGADQRPARRPGRSEQASADHTTTRTTPTEETH